MEFLWVRHPHIMPNVDLLTHVFSTYTVKMSKKILYVSAPM